MSIKKIFHVSTLYHNATALSITYLYTFDEMIGHPVIGEGKTRRVRSGGSKPVAKTKNEGYKLSNGIISALISEESCIRYVN